MLKVVVGIVLNDNKEVLVAMRRPGQHLAGCWEFPGGKIEENEAPIEALQREFLEEVGISILKASPLLRVNYQYEEKTVELDTWHIVDYKGDPKGCEGQLIRWVNCHELIKLPMPPANREIVLGVQQMMKLQLV